MKSDLLHVIAVVSNPVRFRSRYQLFKKFLCHAHHSGAQVYVVEIAYGDRPFECAELSNLNHFRFRTRHELWHKENMINLGISRLPIDWKYVAWVDADITFSRCDWATETVHQLQHYDIVQMFSHAIDLGPQEEPFQFHEGFCYSYIQSLIGSNPVKSTEYYYAQGKNNQWHPGYAWAARREAIDALGGLMEFPILGAADHHMARSLIGEGEKTLPVKIGNTYRTLVRQWQDRAERYVKRNIGYVPGTIVHHFHGSKRKRYYTERWKILTENGYDPFVDLKKDSQGLLQLTDRNIRLRDDIRAYFRSRDEDGTEV